MSNDARHLTARVRRLQLTIVCVGMAASILAPVMMFAGSFSGIWWTFPLVSYLLQPVLYGAFARAIDEAAVRLGGAPAPASTSKLVWLLLVPAVGTVVEVVILSSLARQTAATVDDPSIAARVRAIAIARAAWLFLGGSLLAALSRVLLGELAWMAQVVANPVISLMLLGLATQWIVQPLLDRTSLDTPLHLGATGAATSTAFSTSPTATRDERR